MVQLRLLILVANLLFLRTIVGQVEEAAPTNHLGPPEDGQQQTYMRNSSNVMGNHEETSSSSADASILDRINSLDFAPMPAESAGSPAQVDESPKVAIEPTVVAEHPTHNTPVLPQKRRTGKADQGEFKQQQTRRRTQAQPISQLLINMLGQLERIDLKRIIVDSLEQVKRSNPTNDQPLDWLASVVAPLWPSRARATQRSSNDGTTNTTAKTMSNQTNKHQANRTRERISVGALSAETGNLLSITKQLVKLARSGITGSEFGAGLGHSLAPWMAAPIMMPSMLSAASHMFGHDSGSDFTSATLKSEWFWVVVPAVIVIGAGVIVIPLIAAWLVSHMMNQNTFTVTPAGRRRRKRHAPNSNEGPGNPFRSDLLKMLDIHQLLNDEPELLVGKLSQFHKALDYIGSGLLDSAMQSKKNLDFGKQGPAEMAKKRTANNLIF